MIIVDPYRFGGEAGPASSTFEITWWQYAVDSDLDGNIDKARMGLKFYDAGANLLSSTFSEWVTGPLNAWGERTHTGVIPDAATSARLTLEMDRLDGIENDAYIDDIALAIDGAPVVLTNPGAETGTAGWTSTTGTLTTKAASPAPHTGAAYFYGGNDTLVSAYQTVAL
jgi:hypothetical protein